MWTFQIVVAFLFDDLVRSGHSIRWKRAHVFGYVWVYAEPHNGWSVEHVSSNRQPYDCMTARGSI